MSFQGVLKDEIIRDEWMLKGSLFQHLGVMIENAPSLIGEENEYGIRWKVCLSVCLLVGEKQEWEKVRLKNKEGER